MEPIIFAIGGHSPKIHPSAFIAPGAVICGDVEIGENASVWYGCVIRGDTNKIIIGAGANIQDGTVMHVDWPSVGGVPSVIGEKALIGHKCMLHGATVHDGGFVGMGATMLDGAVVETGAMLAAGAFLTQKKTVPAGELWAGVPAKKFRDLRDGEERYGVEGAERYIAEAQEHIAALSK